MIYVCYVCVCLYIYMKHTHVPSMVIGTKYMLNKCYRNQNQIEVDIWEARAILNINMDHIIPLLRPSDDFPWQPE